MMIGVGLDARLGLSFGQLREMGREAERLGFESLWSPYVGVPDAFHICAAWGQDTGLRTGISVVPAALLWTPAALAMQSATVAQLSDGRFVLGLGTGGVGPGFWAAVGLPERPIAVMRKYTTSVHQLLAGQAVSSDGLTLGPRTSALRAAGLAGRPTPSSKSRMTPSAPDAGPLAKRSGRSAGVKRRLRIRERSGISVSPCDMTGCPDISILTQRKMFSKHFLYGQPVISGLHICTDNRSYLGISSNAAMKGAL